MSRHILVDIDSTAFATHELTIQLMNEHFGTDYTFADVDDWHNPKNIEVEHSIWRWSDECFGNPDFDRRLSPKENAVQVINKLIAQGDNVTFVTDRPLSMYDVTRNLLDRYGFNTVPLIFTEGTGLNKVQLCDFLVINTMIEDSPSHAKKATQVDFIQQVFLFDYAYNREVEGDKIHRVTTWKEIEEALCV